MSQVNFLPEPAAAKVVLRGTMQAMPAAGLFLKESDILTVCQILYRQGYRVVALDGTPAWSEQEVKKNAL